MCGPLDLSTSVEDAANMLLVLARAIGAYRLFTDDEPRYVVEFSVLRPRADFYTEAGVRARLHRSRLAQCAGKNTIIEIAAPRDKKAHTPLEVRLKMRGMVNSLTQDILYLDTAYLLEPNNTVILGPQKLGVNVRKITGVALAA